MKTDWRVFREDSQPCLWSRHRYIIFVLSHLSGRIYVDFGTLGTRAEHMELLFGRGEPFK